MKHPTHQARSIVVLALTLIASSTDGAWSQDSERNNLEHPADQKTVPLGSLGRAVIAGHGPQAMILIPGWGFGEDLYGPFVEENRDRYTMLIAVPPGYGGTLPPPMPEPAVYSSRPWLRAFEAATWELAELLEFEDPVLVGFGDEFQCAVRMALANPGDVNSLVCLGGGPAREQRQPMTPKERAVMMDTQMPEMWFKTVSDATWADGMGSPGWHSIDKTIGEKMFAAALVPTIPTMVRHLCELWSHDPRKELNEAGFPILALHYSPDQDAPPSFRRFAKLLRSSWDSVDEDLVEHRTLENSRMNFVRENAPWISAQIASFLDDRE